MRYYAVCSCIRIEYCGHAWENLFHCSQYERPNLFKCELRILLLRLNRLHEKDGWHYQSSVQESVSDIQNHMCKYTLCGMPFPVHPILLPWSISCAPDAASYTLESIVECVGRPHSNVLAVECMISYQLFTLHYTFMSWCIGHAFYKHCIAAKLHAHVTLTTLGA